MLTPLRWQAFPISVLLCLSVIGCATSSARKRIPASDGTPDRLLFLVFDQLRYDFLDRFDLPNFKRLRAMSRDYSNAYLGYMGAETVVSHLVLPSGKLPRELPWQDDVFRDGKGQLGNVGGFYSVGSLSTEQYHSLMASMPAETRLVSALKQARGGKVYAAGTKGYAATIFGGPDADSIISVKKANGVCTPDGVNMPSFISSNPRFTLECTKKYGTDATYYALDGSRHVPGDDPAHAGGDVWTADVGLEIIERDESWTGLFLTFNGIDKVAHMLGEHDGKRPESVRDVSTPFTLEVVARTADEQLGKLLAALERKGLLESTLVVLTADHGGQSDTRYLGNGQTAKLGMMVSEGSKPAPTWVTHMASTNDIEFSFQDSAIRIWLKQDSAEARARVLEKMKEVPGLIEAYGLKKKDGGWAYERQVSSLDNESTESRLWAKQRNQEIVDAMATEDAPHLVGLLADGTGFDLIGDHGGAQEKVQRVPLMVRQPGEPPSVVAKPIRLSEVAPLIRGILKLDVR